MITFTNIRYKNFLSSGNLWTEIGLNTHKNTLIMGHNGAGKSTLLDALTFSLFGKPFRKVNKGNVVNSINNKQCVVEIEFNTNNNQYKVVRGIKPNVFEIWCNDTMINQDAASKDYQNYLEKNILKMSYKTFTQVVILGSASFVPFMQLSAADRRAVIEDLLDIQIFSAMTSVIKTKLQINKDAIEKNRVVLTSKQDNRSYIQRTLASLRANNEEKLIELEIKKSELETKLTAERQTFDSLENHRDKMLEKEFDTSSLKTKHNKLSSFRAKMEGNRNRYIKDIDFFAASGSCPTCKQQIDSDFAKNMIEDNTQKINELNDGLNKVTEQIDSVLSEIEKIDEVIRNVNKIIMDISSCKSTCDHLQNSLNQIILQIENFAQSDKTAQESERQLAEVEHDISALEEEKKELLDDRQYIDMASLLLKDGGIKTRIVKQYLPIINKHINKYLASLNFFVNFNINENFEESIKSRHRDDFSYNNFSEGEKLRIDLAILLTWRQIAKLKNSIDVNILIFDEILDRAMDGSGIDEFIRIMWQMGEKGNNIFVISHKDTMMERFERTLQFEKVKNFSVLTKE